MGDPAEDTVEQLEEQLAGAEKTLSRLRPLDREQALRVTERMDRLHSQLMAISEPPDLQAAHARLGTEPAGTDEFKALAGQMGPPDGEG